VNTKQDIQEFMAQKTLAVAGASRDEKSFSAITMKELKTRGYRLLPVNPNAKTIGGEKCWPDLASLPEKVGGVLIFTKPEITEKIVRDAAAAGITRVWIQQGAQSEAAVRACKEKGLTTVSGKCVNMFAEPVSSIHGVHRWFAKVFGTMPK
jgi:hypothetical protein